MNKHKPFSIEKPFQVPDGVPKTDVVDNSKGQSRNDEGQKRDIEAMRIG